MAVYGNFETIPGLVAGADLSGSQYKVVKLASTAGQVVLVGSSTGVAVGIIQNDPASGQPAVVAVNGLCKALAGPADVAINDVLGYDSTSRVADHTTDNRVIIARAVTASTAANDIISVYVHGPATRY